MKNVFILLAALVLSTALAGCGQQAAVVKADGTAAQTNAVGQSSTPTTNNNIAYLFKVDASSSFEKAADDFHATPDKLNDGIESNYWMTAQPHVDRMAEWADFHLNGNTYVEAVELVFTQYKIWNGITNDTMPRDFVISALVNGQKRVLKRCFFNREERVTLPVNLSNVSSVRIDFQTGSSDGYVRMNELRIYGKATESKEFVYRYKMTDKEAADLKKSDAIYQSRNASGSNYLDAMDRVLTLNKDILKEHPDNPYARMNLGQAYAEIASKAEGSDQHHQYVEMAEAELQLANNPKNPERSGLLKYLLSLYRTELQTDKYNQTLEELKALNATTTNWGDYYRALAADDKQGMDHAAEIYAYVTNTDDLAGFQGFLCKYTSRLLFEKKYENAIETGSYLNRYAPDFEWVRDGSMYEKVGLSLMALRRWEEAIGTWKGFLEATVTPIGTGECLISYCYLKLSNVSKAYDWYVAYLHRKNLTSSNIEYARTISKEVIKPYYDSQRAKNRLIIPTAEWEELFVPQYKIYLQKYGVTLSNTNNYIVEINDNSAKYLNKYSIGELK